MLEELWGWRPRCVLIASTGGGGDAASAAYHAKLIARWGARSVLAVLPWERFVRDPSPGPLPLDSIAGVERLDYTARALPGCNAFREGRVVEPAACRLAAALQEPLYLLDGYGGAAGVAQGLKEVAGIHGCDAVVAFDVGGDMLAQGCEDGLWSPLGDSLGLAAAASAFPGVSVAAVYAPGADGELPAGLVLERAHRLGYVWARGVSRHEEPVLRELVSLVHTEAGRIPLLALRGPGEAAIRMGTRRIRLSLESLLTVFLDAVRASSSTVAALVSESSSLEEARRRLNYAGVYTELDLEEDIALFRALHGRLPGALELVEIRRRGRERLAPCRGAPGI